MRRLLFFLPVLGYSAVPPSPQNIKVVEVLERAPWFTGSLISSSADVTPAGHYDWEPYLYVTNFTGFYNNKWHRDPQSAFWSINGQMYFQGGLAKKVDMVILPQFFYQRTQGVSSLQLGDLLLGLEYQILSYKAGVRPAIKLALFESVPFGKYQKGNPKKQRTDLVGSGSWETTFELVVGYLFHISDAHFFNLRAGVDYTIPAHVYVRDFNTYGGGFGTRGTVHPGRYVTPFIGLEYSFSQNWVFAFDGLYTHTNKTTFSGTPGVTRKGRPAFTGFASSEQISMAPAIEYNFNESTGILVGSWFTVAGRNASSFISGVIALNIYR